MTTLDELDSLTSADDADLLLINDVSEATNKGKKITIANLFAKIFSKLMAGLGVDLTANHLLSWDGTNSKIADSGIAKGVTVNGHPLTANVTVSKSDVSLGSVANTGDSATPASGGTTKFTTGGAYTMLTQFAPYFSTSTAYSVGNMVTYQGKLYKCTTAHSAGAWNASHFTAKSLKDLISAVVNTGDSATPTSSGTTKFTTGGAYNLLTSLAPIFSTSKAYAVGALCTYNGKLYKCTTAHAAGAWNASHFTAVSLDSCTSNSNALIATSKTITNAPVLTKNQVVKIMFTSALTASNATTALVISYNGSNVTVKAPKDGSLIDYVAKAVGSSYYYCQAYTTLELLYDGTNFIIVGNPVVYSTSDYTIYTDGSTNLNNFKPYVKKASQDTIEFTIDAPDGYIQPHLFLVAGTVATSGYSTIHADLFNVVVSDGGAFSVNNSHFMGTITVIQSISYENLGSGKLKITIKTDCNRITITSLCASRIY